MPEGHKETPQITFIPQVLAWYIQYKHIFSQLTHIQKMLILLTLCPKAQWNFPTYTHPLSVGMIYPILTYIFNCYIVPKMYILPTLCPKGTMKLSNLHPSPKIWHVISNTKIFIQLTHNPKMFKCSKFSKMFHNFPCHNSHVIIFHVIISMSKWVPVQIFPSSKFFKFKWVPDEKIP